MPDAHALGLLRIPSETLIALDWRPFHFALQPYHHLVRLTHILSVSLFFGGIALLDLRLTGVRGTVSLRPFAERTLPWLWVTFGIAMVTGIALFLYDPLHVGAHAYFTLKLLLIGLGLANAAVFHQTGYLRALASEGTPPTNARLAGGVSILLWTGVMVCACLNVEAEPKVFLR
jgi:hypothetical protein